jgi:hypothetical protein
MALQTTRTLPYRPRWQQQTRSVCRIHDRSDNEWAAHLQDPTKRWLSDPEQSDTALAIEVVAQAKRRRGYRGLYEVCLTLSEMSLRNLALLRKRVSYFVLGQARQQGCD